jgi:hypothetical protein
VAHANKGNRVAPAACNIALTSLELASTTIGLGAAWACHLNAAATSFTPMPKALPMPKDHQAFGSMIVGYSMYGYQRMPNRNEPKIT